ncbi:carbon-nitrogen hydrolase family protein [Psychromonas sp. KJ10-2]|uniref:carbon-nitrogen hydrolase family protein n=1 Tax=Psychromonas sp. KJ10-2 TaxID=3391822 RepID=UPI0039B692CE
MSDNHKTCTLTAIQIISSDCIEHNFEQVKEQLDTLSFDSDSEHLVLLPENALCFGDRQAYLLKSEALGDGVVQRRLAELARAYSCTLICGSFPIKSEQSDKVYTTCLVYSAQGQLLDHYHKIHLFDADVEDAQGAYRESDTFIPGQQVKVVDCGFAKVGLAICYDLRFPGLFQQLREQGAEIIILPAAFTQVTGEAHWQALLQARAIETQCYMLAANQGGVHFVHQPEHKTRHTYGHSMIVDAWGAVVTQLTTGNGVVQADFSLHDVIQIRKKMPVQQHNRFTSIYK